MIYKIDMLVSQEIQEYQYTPGRWCCRFIDILLLLPFCYHPFSIIRHRDHKNYSLRILPLLLWARLGHNDDSWGIHQSFPTVEGNCTAITAILLLLQDWSSLIGYGCGCLIWGPSNGVDVINIHHTYLITGL